MWHTSRGDRTLQGDEAVLVGTAIDTMIDALLVHVDVDFVDEVVPDCDSGIDVYDALTVCQRIGSLHEVAQHLLTETRSTLSLSALAEATVAAIFAEVRDQTSIEIDLFGGTSEPDFSWRRMVLDAYVATSDLLPAQLPDASCQQISTWEDLIDILAGAILWDRDFEMADSFLDIDPGVSQQRRKLLGIGEDYFTSVAPDPRPEEAFSLVSRTRAIVRVHSR